MYCQGCAYDLRGQSEGVCPECRRAFDPADPTTYVRSPLRKWQRRQYLGLSAVVFQLGLVIWYCFQVKQVVPLFMITLLVLIGCGAMGPGIALRTSIPRRRFMVIAAIPAAVLLLTCASLGMHMVRSLGGWPTNIGFSGFPPLLEAHAQLTVGYYGIVTMIELMVVPLLIIGFACTRRSQQWLYHAGFQVMCWAVGNALLLLAPDPFLYWWID